MTYFELSPAYGRDYKNKKEAIEAFETGKDWIGDYQLGFKPINVNDIPKPCTVNLRYGKQTKIAVCKVAVGQVARAETKLAENSHASVILKPKVPSMATLQRWMFDGVAKATDGCEVEPDGHCEHGKPSWLLKLGVI